jgi:EAL domain-containing protein (putative c-di-GMP-specific phosphodiesterase class I)
VEEEHPRPTVPLAFGLPRLEEPNCLQTPDLEDVQTPCGRRLTTAMERMRFMHATASNTPRDAGVVVFRDRPPFERVAARPGVETLTWLRRIRAALDEDRFVLHSQPIVPLADGELTEEVLVRMVDRDGRLIPPGAFLPMAERFDLIGEIDEWVVSRAIRMAGRSGRRVAINLSGSSIVARDLLPLIEGELEHARVDPTRVVFEITETTLMGDLDAGEAFARGLSKLGCGLALDDFGTGFGSFTYLKKLPIAYLKIDMEFVRGLGSSLPNQHIVRAIVNLARGFGARTIGEGVEDSETMLLLADYGVDFAQGFYLGRPRPVECP